MYQLFVGEIGISRREFLYDIRYWEARRIISGYKRRNVLTYQLLRITAYSAYFSTRKNEKGQWPHEWLPLYFDNDKEQNEPPISDEDIRKLQEDMAAMNLQLSEARK